MSLVLKNISKSYENKNLLSNFSYSFNDKGIYAIVGASGIGKTTLLRIIAGLDKDFEGEVIGGGLKNISMCFQEHRLFPNLTLFDNIAKFSFKKESEDTANKINSLLKRLRFSDEDMTLYPDEISGGMKQRAAFARAVLKDSNVLILDEATKELDMILRNEILEIIKEEGKKRLVIMVTHRDDEIIALEATKIALS